MSVKLTVPEIRSYNALIWKIALGFLAIFIIIIALTAFGVFGPLPSKVWTSLTPPLRTTHLLTSVVTLMNRAVDSIMCIA